MTQIMIKALGVVDLIVALVLFFSTTPIPEIGKYILIIILIIKAFASFYY